MIAGAGSKRSKCTAELFFFVSALSVRLGERGVDTAVYLQPDGVPQRAQMLSFDLQLSGVVVMHQPRRRVTATASDQLIAGIKLAPDARRPYEVPYPQHFLNRAVHGFAMLEGDDNSCLSR